MPGQWYFARDRKKHGPVSMEQLKEMVQRQALKPANLVMEDGSTKWVPASSVAGLFDQPPPTAPATEEPEKQPTGKWYYMREGKRHGPVSVQQLQDLARNKEILPTDMVLEEGTTDWVTANTIPGVYIPMVYSTDTEKDTEVSSEIQKNPTDLMISGFAGGYLLLLLFVSILLGGCISAFVYNIVVGVVAFAFILPDAKRFGIKDIRLIGVILLPIAYVPIYISKRSQMMEKPGAQQAGAAAAQQAVPQQAAAQQPAPQQAAASQPAPQQAAASQPVSVAATQPIAPPVGEGATSKPSLMGRLIRGALLLALLACLGYYVYNDARIRDLVSDTYQKYFDKETDTGEPTKGELEKEKNEGQTVKEKQPTKNEKPKDREFINCRI